MCITSPITRYSTAIVLLLLAALTAGSLTPIARAQDVQRPLTLPGKETLYQRVIAVPGAGLAVEPGGEAAQDVTPFTVFYVYARRTVNGLEWLQVGTKNNGRLEGWLPAEQGIDWKQTLTVGFKDPANQGRVMLFGERGPLKQLAESHDVERYRALRRQAEQGMIGDSPVIAMQPDTYVNIRRNFYLVPILEHEDILVGNHQGRLLHVATVPLRDPSAGYRAAVMFVIDTTISMGPYIDRTRSTMKRVYQAIQEADLTERVNFGLIGYRDNTSTAPGLGYTTRLFAGLSDTATGEEFLAQTETVTPAGVSSKDFNEDAYAGIMQAIEEGDWNDYDARYIILITDAGPRVSGDELSQTGMSTDSLRRLASDHNIALWVMHLRTPEGADNHAYAEEQYRELSRIEDIGDFYYPVETGDVNSFEQALSAMTEQLTSQVAMARQASRPGTRPVRESPPTDQPEKLAEFQEKVAKLGYALRMRYLRGAAGGVPKLFDAWMVDRDFDDPSRQSVDVRVLLTRNQLSDLHDVLKKVLITAEQGTIAPKAFLDDLKSLAATISRDPEAANTATATTGGTSLAELGYMREYIEGLPYRSAVMDLDLETWQQWSAQRQFEFVNELESKVTYYKALHNNVDLWVSLDGGPVDGDSVYPLLLEALP